MFQIPFPASKVMIPTVLMLSTAYSQSIIELRDGTPATNFAQASRATPLRLRPDQTYKVRGSFSGQDHMYSVKIPEDSNRRLEVEMSASAGLLPGIYLYAPTSRDTILSSMSAGKGRPTSMLARVTPGATYYLTFFGNGQGSFEVLITAPSRR